MRGWRLVAVAAELGSEAPGRRRWRQGRRVVAVMLGEVVASEGMVAPRCCRGRSRRVAQMPHSRCHGDGNWRRQPASMGSGDRPAQIDEDLGTGRQRVDGDPHGRPPRGWEPALDQRRWEIGDAAARSMEAGDLRAWLDGDPYTWRRVDGELGGRRRVGDLGGRPSIESSPRCGFISQGHFSH